MYLPYIIIPIVTTVTAVIGGIVTSANLGWYSTLVIPWYAPPGSIIGMVWTILFILITISALLVWSGGARSRSARKKVDESVFRWRVDISLIFLLNAVLNVWWSVLFFGFHQMFWAIWAAFALGITVAVLIRLLWMKSKMASFLLTPYLAWVAFATHLTYTVWVLNK